MDETNRCESSVDDVGSELDVLGGRRSSNSIFFLIRLVFGFFVILVAWDSLFAMCCLLFSNRYGPLANSFLRPDLHRYGFGREGLIRLL